MVVVIWPMVVAVVASLISLLDVLDEYLPDLAILSVNLQFPVEPIFRVVGLFFGIKTHEPDLAHFLVPVEFVETTSDSFFT